MFDLTREFKFDAGHRVLGHGGQCRFLHGHTYYVEITLSTTGLDKLGMVVDFADVKKIVGGWIDENLDHNMLLNTDDPLCDVSTNFIHFRELFANKEPFKFRHENPTAENIAKMLFQQTKKLLPDYSVKSVRVWETEKCSATYSEEVK